MNKILILTASTGGGHNKAAQALEKEYKKNGHQVIIIDILKLMHNVVEHVFTEGYDFLYSNFPKLYSSMYKHSDNNFLGSDTSVLIGKVFRKRVLDTILKVRPDLIVGTHAFTVGIITKLKKRGQIDIPFVSIVTDFKAHATYLSKHVDAYITGSSETNYDMMRKGISKTLLYDYGIPIDSEFNSELYKLISNRRKKNVMVMGGSLCNIDMVGIVNELCNSANNFNITVVCGKNKTIYKEVKDYVKGIEDRKIRVYSYTNNIPKLMYNSDILITKPGGLTISEALVSRLPMIVPCTLPGQEEDNLRFLVDNKMAYYTQGSNGIADIIDELLGDNLKFDSIVKNMETVTENYGIDKIVSLSTYLINNSAVENIN